MKPIELLYTVPLIIATIAIYMKVRCNTQLYNKRKNINASWRKYMQTLEGMKVFYPIVRSSASEEERELIRKANRWIVLFYVMIILIGVMLIFIGNKSELFQ